MKSGGIGIALGGGAARGLSHIGVLQVIESRGIPVDVVTGSSMGAIIGAIYALEGNADALIKKMESFFESEAFQAAQFDSLRERREEEEGGFLNSMALMLRRGYKYSLSVTRKSIIEHDVFQMLIEELVPDIGIEELPLPFAAASLDTVSGREVIWTSGSLRDALWSSSAIPGFFPPLEKDGMVLVDGGWTNAVPVGPARSLGADKVIAVDISREVEEIMEYKRGISLVLRSAMLTTKHLRELQLLHADVVLRPAVGHVHWADFSDPYDLIQRGKDAALVSLEDIEALARTSLLPSSRTLGGRLRNVLQARLRRGAK
ncbi:MAG: patatin-like phospholipase family protein [bacterium]